MVGAGVVGLTCAVRLLEAGHRVDVVARDLPLETTSAVAAAIWYPYRALPQDRVTAWAGDDVRRARRAGAPEEYGGSPEAGVRMVAGHRGVHPAQPRPLVAVRGPGAWTGRPRLPAGYVDGWTLHDPGGRDAGLPGLARRRVAELGGTVTRLNLRGAAARAATWS